MSTGRVSHYDYSRGFGFIIRDDGGPDVFVYVSHLANADLLKQGQSVSFEIVTDPGRGGKLRADRVRVMEDDRCAAEAQVWKITPED
jgi:CspA family cold shock protein